MSKFYREQNGDFLIIFDDDCNNVRAACIEGSPSSVAGTVIDRGYLEECEPVKWHQVPRRWRFGIVGPYTAAAWRRLDRQPLTA